VPPHRRRGQRRRGHGGAHYGQLPRPGPVDGRAQTLYLRIQHAAGEVCDHPRNLEPQYDYLARAKSLCRQHAIAEAVTGVHNPQLTALYTKSPPKLIAMVEE
jgi:hypothetical protein